ncbi:MAG: PIN/TRAM domain-containing protein [Clostridia bacterium]|nr:PIN/TRAM domain-containing protein [Clostridia bacterium]
MFNKIIRGSLTFAGATAGYAIGMLISKIIKAQRIVVIGSLSTLQELIISIVSAILFGSILFVITPWLMRKGLRSANWVETELQKIPTTDIIVGSIGLIIGLIIAYLISQLIIPIPYVGNILSVIIYIFLGYLGVSIATKKINDLINFPNIFRRNTSKEKSSNKEVYKSKPKILDTSVIIDGRIADVCKTGFVEGPLVIPEFVLEELRHIADSSDSLKRNRGRRGLDILNKIQKELEIEVQITEKDFEEIAEVDSKLVRLGQIMSGKIITNDFNLNKVSELQGVPVLNINELANSVKPVVLPGEEMIVQVIKEGKELNQGVAYLDDGTMIVVDGGKKHIGETMDVMVTSVLQTAAGRLIFAKPKNMINRTA